MPAPGKHELRTYVPDAAYGFLKERCGTRGVGEFIHDVCLDYQKHTALDER